jgi:hypothetical protein
LFSSGVGRHSVIADHSSDRGRGDGRQRRQRLHQRRSCSHHPRHRQQKTKVSKEPVSQPIFNTVFTINSTYLTIRKQTNYYDVIQFPINITGIVIIKWNVTLMKFRHEACRYRRKIQKTQKHLILLYLVDLSRHLFANTMSAILFKIYIGTNNFFIFQ